jgi:hypothetical protein
LPKAVDNPKLDPIPDMEKKPEEWISGHSERN